MRWSRRTFLAAGGALAVTPFTAVQSVAVGSYREQLDFKVLRDGGPIGHHRLDIRGQGNRTTVDIDIMLEVGIGPLVLYRYDHKNREVWENGAFKRFDSRTDDDGDIFSVTAERRDGRIFVRRQNDSDYSIAESDILPTTYWREETVRRNLLLDTQEGRKMQVEARLIGDDDVVAGGRTVRARKYEMTGDLTATAWYDETGRWVKLAFPLKGSQFEYVLR